MTDKQESQFNSRADNAAMMLKQGMTDYKTQKQLESTPVQVGSDGKPPAPPPPDGSYAAMAQQQAQQQQPPPARAETTPAPQPPTAPAPPEPQGDLTPNAQERFSEMSQQLRAKDQQLQAIQEEARQRATTEQQLRDQLKAAQEEQRKMLEENLDSLDPDARARVMADARFQELFEGMEQRLEQRFGSAIQALEVDRQQQQMTALARKYALFNIELHGPLIEMFRERNPQCSVEQAYRAVAQDGELALRDSTLPVAAPPVVAPGGGGTQQQRYMPTPEPDPVEQMREEARKAADLARSNNHDDRNQSLKMFDKLLSDRLGDRIPR